MKTLARFTVVVGIVVGTTGCLAPKEMPASMLTPEHTVAVELRYASAIDVAELLNGLIAESREAMMSSPSRACALYAPENFTEPSPCAPSAWVGPRSNVVVVRVEAPEEEPRVRDLLARLDVPR